MRSLRDADGVKAPSLTLVRRADVASVPGVLTETTVLGAGCRFEGRLDLESPARVDGQFEGQIWSSASLRFGPGSVVSGVVRAQSVRLEGQFEGELYVQGELIVSAQARLAGRVEAAAWTVLAGAQVDAAFRVPNPGHAAEAGST